MSGTFLREALEKVGVEVRRRGGRCAGRGCVTLLRPCGRRGRSAFRPHHALPRLWPGSSRPPLSRPPARWRALAAPAHVSPSRLAPPPRPAARGAAHRRVQVCGRPAAAQRHERGAARAADRAAGRHLRGWVGGPARRPWAAQFLVCIERAGCASGRGPCQQAPFMCHPPQPGVPSGPFARSAGVRSPRSRWWHHAGQAAPLGPPRWPSVFTSPARRLPARRLPGSRGGGSGQDPGGGGRLFGRGRV